MAADNQNRLASFTAWKRGRCKLALHWAKWKKYNWFRPPKKGPGSCSHSASFPPSSPFLASTVWTKFQWKTTSLLRGVICCYLPPQSRPDRTSPAAEAAPLSFTSSFSSFFCPTPQIFCRFFAIKSSLNPGKALRTRRQNPRFLFSPPAAHRKR